MSWKKAKKFTFRCILCKKKTKTADVKTCWCQACKSKRPLCACGCGKQVNNFNRKYILGHAQRDPSNLQIRAGHQAQALAIRGDANPSKRPEVRKKLSQALQSRVCWMEGKTQAQIDLTREHIVRGARGSFARAARYKYKDSKGKCYRSNFEVAVAELLYLSGVSFDYERVLHVGARAVYPDFTIMNGTELRAIVEVTGCAFKSWRLGFINKVKRIREAYPCLPIVVFVKPEIAPLLLELAKLPLVRVCVLGETPRELMQSLVVESDHFNFDYLHFIPWHKGQCAAVHGHSSKLVVMISGVAAEDDMLVDFADVKARVKEVIGLVDHKVLAPVQCIKKEKTDSVVIEFTGRAGFHRMELPKQEVTILPSDSTIENISMLLAQALLARLPSNIRQVVVQVHEGVGKGAISASSTIMAEDAICSMSDPNQLRRMLEFYRHIDMEAPMQLGPK